MSSSTKGTERELFAKLALHEVFTPPYRFGTGDITDIAGRRSGQVDIVVEFPFLPSLPVVNTGPRLYLAEGVAAAIEVKSDLAAQWSQVEQTAQAIASLQRVFGSTFSMGPPPQPRIPFFAVGYTGWNQLNTVQNHIGPAVDGIFVADAGLFASSQQFGALQAAGDWSLWGLICCLHQAAVRLGGTSASPHSYAT